mmetsp:Transcript_21562/g.46901  ORF Transcript_21562/g.46901 Transcript_21562/m.46901 type:complete len:452 (-) Transcript_21562:333-1688(-)|eukprot:CAMPEP_0172324046 /NCGR_PEP_ID=MMETSP1058-20130122/50223_1 /TAXON_ID=83371 /ORGANISM="Detonula confervacea, Strain CCMP 353" /LENGTH=451 /DNA_ID=CAMNT_0013040207 /DNA_START=115 /DNA_END=1470 /DNA_ORIENTATION=+
MDLCNAKYSVLALLVIQNTFYVLLVCYTRTRPGELYLSSTAVCCDEAIKLVTCLVILTLTYLFEKRQLGDRDGGGRGSLLNASERNGTTFADSRFSNDTADDEDGIEKNNIDDTAQPINSHESFRTYLGKNLQFDYRMAGLAGLFIVQKNLLYLAMSNLDAAVFQVTYQIKVLTTAIFSVLLLKRKLTSQQVVALVLLTLGVAIVQLDKVDENASKSYQEQNRLVGVMAVLGASCTSGFGGVYFELVLKPRTNPEDGTSSTPTRPPPSVWAKNVQLSTFGLIIALATAFVKDGSAILSNGFFQGYTPLVVAVILLQALGGLTVAAIIKYADNILKSFAAAMSIVGSTIISAWVFGFSISKLFAWGCLLQIISIWLYARKNENTDKKQLLVQTSEIALMRMDSGMDSTSSDVENVEIREKRGRSLFSRKPSVPLEIVEGCGDPKEKVRYGLP